MKLKPETTKKKRYSFVVSGFVVSCVIGVGLSSAPRPMVVSIRHAAETAGGSVGRRPSGDIGRASALTQINQSNVKNMTPPGPARLTSATNAKTQTAGGHGEVTAGAIQ